MKKVFKVVLLITLIASIAWNLVLLKDSGKLNIDSLKWSVKSLTLKYSDFQNGKIPLIRLQTNLPEIIENKGKSDNPTYQSLITQVSRYYSIFGLEPAVGFNGLPKGLPNQIAKCGVKLGLDKNLYFVSISNKPSSQFVFFNGSPELTALKGSIIHPSRCQVASQITLQKSSLSWLIRRDFKLNLNSNDLPAHFSLVDDTTAIVVSRLGKLQYVSFKQGKVSVTSAQDLNLKLSTSQPHTHFGVKSVLLGKRHFYVATARNDNSCNRLEIYSYPVEANNVIKNQSSGRVIYKSPGCFNSATTELNAIGGRMIFTDENQTHIIFSLGNAEIWTGLEDISSNRNYGVIIELNLANKKNRNVSGGHRNPQGLCKYEGKLYETEQGPDGGDEFNSIEEGKYYGWPEESYGAPYGDFYSRSKLHREFGSHSKHTKPLLSWVPAIAVGDLVCPDLKNHGPWSKNFIAATLKDNSLRRLVLDEGTIRVDERIPMNERIRDTQFSSSGDLVSLSDSGQFVILHFIPRNV